MSNDETPGYEDLGDIPIDGANDANVPVDIWLTPEENDDGERTGRWQLRAANYMPRKGMLGHEYSYKAKADDRSVLVALIQKHWLPLYLGAVDALTELKQDEHGTAGLYYWDPRKERP